MDPSWFVPDERATISYVGLRRAIGLIGLCLPLVLPLGAALLFHERLPASISGYYYTDMRDVFVGSLWAIGVFMLSYRFGRLDRVIATIAGLSAVGVSLFPTTADGEEAATGWAAAAGVLHLVFAGVFFAMLAVFCLVLFVRSGPAPTQAKRVRNGVYRACGVVIVLCIVVGAVVNPLVSPEVKAQWRPLFWLEAAAILAFGLSWFVKGETLFRDAPRPATPLDPSPRAAV